MVAAISVAVLYALRVWPVSVGSPAGTRSLAGVSVAIGIGLLGLAASARRRILVAGVVLSTLGSLIMVCAVAAEYRLGTAAIGSLGPDETVVIGSVRATFSGFEASYAGQGDLLEFRSNLVVDLGSGGRDLSVVSGIPCRLEDYQIQQLGFNLAEGEGGRGIRTSLGFLKQKASRPFIGGFTVLGMGVLVSLLPSRHAKGD